LGISETSSDMQDLLGRETTDGRAAEAVALFCYQVKKTIGAYAAALGGWTRWCLRAASERMHPRYAPGSAKDWDSWCRIGRDRNAESAALISPNSDRVAVRVIHTDEETMIASGLPGSQPRPAN